MNVLALDTSTSHQAVAVWPDGGAPRVRTLEPRRGHSPELLASVDELLREAALDRTGLQLVVAGLGPGSFTGLRIGLATAKGLSYATGAALVGVGSLQTLALAARDEAEGRWVVTATDARRREVYAAVWRFDEGGWPVAVIEPMAVAPGLLGQALAPLPRPLFGVGAGFGIHGDAILAAAGADLQVLPETLWWPDGRRVAELGRHRMALHGPDDRGNLEPLYIRPSDAALPGAGR